MAARAAALARISKSRTASTQSRNDLENWEIYHRSENPSASAFNWYTGEENNHPGPFLPLAMGIGPVVYCNYS